MDEWTQKHKNEELTSRSVNPVEFLDEMIQKHHKEFRQMEKEFEKLQERRDELKKVNENQAEEINRLKQLLLEKQSQPSLKEPCEADEKKIAERSEDNDVSMSIDKAWIEIPAASYNDETQMIMLDTLQVINGVAEIKQESVTCKIPSKIPDYPVVLEHVPIDVDQDIVCSEDEMVLNEMKLIIEQFHEGIQWSDRMVVVTKLFDLVNEDNSKKIFLVTCPECSKKLMICRKAISNNTYVNNLLNYEQHVINQHLF